MLSSKARGVFRHVTEPVGRTLARAGVSADTLTIAGLAGSILAGVLLAAGHVRLGGLVSLLAGLLDVFDGAVAKAAGRIHRWGAFLDSVVDRFSDAAVLTGLVALSVVRDQRGAGVLAVVVLTLSLAVSYTKARAESLGFRCDVGVAERPERVLVLGFALLFGIPAVGLWILFAGTAVTVGQRIWTVWRQAAEEEA